MLAALGGKDAWAAARIASSVERVNVLAIAGEIESRVWRDLDGPGERAELRGESVDRVFAWSAAGGSGIKEGEFYRFSEDRMRNELAFWPLHVHTMYHRLASEDPKLRLSSEDGRTLVIADAGTGAVVTRFVTGPGHDPVLWNATSAFNDETYLYGPLGDFGSMRMPRWGASIDASWRYELLEFTLSAHPPDVSFTVPEPR